MDLERVAALNVQLSQLLETEQRLARTDALTGLPNSRAFREELEKALARNRRDRSPLAVACFDLDNFKILNDTLGHAGGDRALRAAADALARGARTADVAARIGGDEFAVLVADLNLRQTESRLRMLNSSLSAIAFETPTPLKLTLSIGVAEYSAGDTPESLMERADAALYEAKRQGRNRVVGKAKPTMRDMLLRH